MNKPTYIQEYNAIVTVLNHYNEGGKQAKSSIMKPARPPAHASTPTTFPASASPTFSIC